MINLDKIIAASEKANIGFEQMLIGYEQVKHACDHINKVIKDENFKTEEIMKVQNIKNIEGFFKVIDSCIGTVELITDEGDRINLKSNLCKYVSMAKIFSSDSGIKDIEIVAHRPEDISKIVDFLVAGDIK